MARQLREYRARFERMAPGEGVDPEALGQRSKLGGQPDWEQYDETPSCTQCREPMTFVAQVDSIEHEDRHNPHSISAVSPEQQYTFGDVGLLYLFFCENCLEPAAVFQCG